MVNYNIQSMYLDKFILLVLSVSSRLETATLYTHVCVWNVCLSFKVIPERCFASALSTTAYICQPVTWLEFYCQVLYKNVIWRKQNFLLHFRSLINLFRSSEQVNAAWIWKEIFLQPSKWFIENTKCFYCYRYSS